MFLKDFKFLTDENIHPEVVSFLRKAGFDTKDVKESRLSGNSDLFLLKLAHQEGRVILTHDSDFGKIIYTETVDFTGIVYLRPGHFLSEFTISTLDALLKYNLEDINVPFLLVGENTGQTIRVRARNISVS